MGRTKLHAMESQILRLHKFRCMITPPPPRRWKQAHDRKNRKIKKNDRMSSRSELTSSHQVHAMALQGSSHAKTSRYLGCDAGRPCVGRSGFVVFFTFEVNIFLVAVGVIVLCVLCDLFEK